MQHVWGMQIKAFKLQSLAMVYLKDHDKIAVGVKEGKRERVVAGVVLVWGDTEEVGRLERKEHRVWLAQREEWDLAKSLDVEGNKIMAQALCVSLRNTAQGAG